MATSFPLPTLAAQVTATGVTFPSYLDTLESLKASFRAIYGADAYLEPDSQDGQLLAIFAQAIYDSNQALLGAYLSFSPNTAVGAGLSSVVKINHMARAVPSNSQAVVTLVGQAGTIIRSGVVADTSGNRWNLPGSVTIPFGGSISTTATCAVPGAVQAQIGSITEILTPTAGWQSVTNPSAASAGEPVESDAALRLRQQTSTALRSLTVLEGLLGALLALPGVVSAYAYENDTDIEDLNGLPPHSIAVVVQGGDAGTVARTIFLKKAPGCATFGTTTIQVPDGMGIPKDINFFVPTLKPIQVTVTLTVGLEYTSVVGDAIRSQVSAAINALEVGQDVEVTRLYVPALLADSAASKTYKLQSVEAGITPAVPGVGVLTMAFYEKATCLPEHVTLTVV